MPGIAKVTFSRAGGLSVAFEVENGDSIKKLPELVKAMGYGEVSGKLLLNGDKAAPDAKLKDGDVVSEAPTAKGG